MVFVLSLIPATSLVVVGYFVFFASARVEGALQHFGRYLAIWVFFLAGVIVLGGLLAPTLGMRSPMGGLMMGRIGQHMQAMEQMQEEELEILRALRDE